MTENFDQKNRFDQKNLGFSLYKNHVPAQAGPLCKAPTVLKGRLENRRARTMGTPCSRSRSPFLGPVPVKLWCVVDFWCVVLWCVVDFWCVDLWCVIDFWRAEEEATAASRVCLLTYGVWLTFGVDLWCVIDFQRRRRPPRAKPCLRRRAFSDATPRSDTPSPPMA